MRAERVRALQAEFAWLPEDYARLLARVEPGECRYGLSWLDGPQHPGQVAGTAAAASFPRAFWIGRRSGQAVGYALRQDGPVELCEWGRAQRQVLQRFAGIDALILAQLDPASDRRSVIEQDLRIPGMAIAPWRDAGTGHTAECLLSPGREHQALDYLLTKYGGDWELILARADGDSWLCVRRRRSGLERLVAHHGSAGDWQPTTEPEALREMSDLAACNDGSQIQHFARINLPRS